MTDLRVDEIFHSIQGESSRAGYPCVFIRLTGCNLRCSYCDTEYAFSGGTMMSLRKIMEKVSELISPEDRTFIEITGGEPLVQADGVTELCSLLIDNNFISDSMHPPEILIETNGTIPIPDALRDQSMRSRVISFIVDVKTPSSGIGAREQEIFENEVFPYLGRRDELKFVIGGHHDYQWAKWYLSHMGFTVPGRVGAIHFSPVLGKMDPARLARWIIEDKLQVHFQLQLHKILWPDKERGV